MDRVLFACRRNAGRSRLAAPFFNALTSPDRARAVSAGTTPAERVHSKVVTVMPGVETQNWHIEDPSDLPVERVRRIREEIRRRVGDLLKSRGWA